MRRSNYRINHRPGPFVRQHRRSGSYAPANQDFLQNFPAVFAARGFLSTGVFSAWVLRIVVLLTIRLFFGHRSLSFWNSCSKPCKPESQHVFGV
jgi:hypothetical protein